MAERYVFFVVDAPPVGVAAHRIGDEAGPGIVDDTDTVFIARLGPDHDVQAGAPLVLAVDASKLYLFDAGTGVALLP